MTIDVQTVFGDLATMRYDAHVISWTQTLNHHGIDHLVLKGVGFTDWLGRTRIPRDLDLLVPRWRLRRLAALLTDAGYQRVSTEPTASTWLGGQGAIAIDVHDSIKAVRTRHDEVWEAFSAARTTVSRAGVLVPVPGDPVRQLHVMVHLSQSGLSDLGALEDATAALAVSSMDAWRAAHELSIRLGCRVLFEAPLRVLAEAADVRAELGLTPGESWLLSQSGPARDHALAVVSVSVQRDLTERMVQAGRLARMHPRQMGAISGRSGWAWCLHRFKEASGSVRCVRELHREILEGEAEE